MFTSRRFAMMVWILAISFLISAFGAWYWTRTGTEPDQKRSTLVIQRGSTMSVVKVLELVGESQSSFDNAVQNAVEEAARTIDNITGVEVANWTANVQDGRLSEYKANVKIAFAVDSRKRSQ